MTPLNLLVNLKHFDPRILEGPNMDEELGGYVFQITPIIPPSKGKRHNYQRNKKKQWVQK